MKLFTFADMVEFDQSRIETTGELSWLKPPRNCRSRPMQKRRRLPFRRSWHPFESLRREVDRLFDDFGTGLWRAPFRRSLFDVEPFWNREFTFGTAPAVDVVEKDKTYEITAELPGMDEKNVEVLFSDGVLTIKGEKQEEKEEKKKDYYHVRTPLWLLPPLVRGP